MSYLIVIAAVVAIIFPLFYMVATSLKTGQGITSFPPKIIPDPATIKPYFEAFETGPWANWFTNSLIISICSTILLLSLTVPAAYAIARYDFLGQKAVFFGLISTMMLPAQILLLPLFVEFVKLGLIDSYLGLILVYTALFSGFTTFLLHGFFKSLPTDVEEAGRVAGISEWKIFVYIILPLAKPAIAVAGIFLFIFTWNEYLFALVFMQDQSMYTVSVGLTFFQGNRGQTAMNQMMAMSTLASVPVLLLFALTQERFIQGITTGFEF